MSRLLLIRHGQASLGQANYDQLSALGRQQSRWLGEYLAAQDVRPTKLLMGELTRHRETAEALCEGLGQPCEFKAISAWNEFDFYAILKAYLAQHPQQKLLNPQPKDFFALLRKAIKLWSDDQLNGPIPETWQDFECRVANALSSLQTEAEQPLTVVVSSGGAIAMALKHILRLDNDAMIDLNLQTRNTALTECHLSPRRIVLSSFNTVPHLDTPDRRQQITFA